MEGRERFLRRGNLVVSVDLWWCCVCEKWDRDRALGK